MDDKIVNRFNKVLSKHKKELVYKAFDDELRTDMGLNSLDIVEIAILCEGEFNVNFVEDEVIKLKTIGDFINLIKKKIEI